MQIGISLHSMMVSAFPFVDQSFSNTHYLDTAGKIPIKQTHHHWVDMGPQRRQDMEKSNDFFIFTTMLGIILAVMNQNRMTFIPGQYFKASTFTDFCVSSMS